MDTLSTHVHIHTHSLTHTYTHTFTHNLTPPPLPPSYTHTHTHKHTHTYTCTNTLTVPCFSGIDGVPVLMHGAPIILEACSAFSTARFSRSLSYSLGWYGVATVSRLLQIIGLFCRISSLL